MDVDDDEEPAASMATGSASTVISPPEAQAEPAILSSVNTFPTAEGVKWDIEEHASWGTLLWPTKRRGSGVKGESVAHIKTFLDFSEQRSCGNHDLVNRILSMSISISHLKKMNERWTTCGSPDIATFTSFLKKRVTDNKDTLLSLFHDPVEYADGWYSYL